MNEDYKVGDKVFWTSQAGGYSKRKEGVIAAVVAPSEKPSREKFIYLYRDAGIGLMPRKQTSYVVMVGNRPRADHGNPHRHIRL